MGGVGKKGIFMLLPSIQGDVGKKRGVRRKFCTLEFGGSLLLFIQEAKNLEQLARGCYSDVIAMSSTDFSQMMILMILYGLFIIEFFRQICESVAHDSIIIKPSVFPILMADLLKIENQLPFTILVEFASITMAGLGCDQLVVNLFDNLAKNSSFSRRRCYMSKEFMEIETFYNRSWAYLSHTYFTSPLSSVLAWGGVTMLYLASLQTMATVLSFMTDDRSPMVKITSLVVAFGIPFSVVIGSVRGKKHFSPFQKSISSNMAICVSLRSFGATRFFLGREKIWGKTRQGHRHPRTNDLGRYMGVALFQRKARTLLKKVQARVARWKANCFSSKQSYPYTFSCFHYPQAAAGGEGTEERAIIFDKLDQKSIR